MNHSLSSPQFSAKPQSLLGRFLQFLRKPYYTVNVEADHQGIIDILRLYALALVIVLPLGVLSSTVARNLESSNTVLDLARSIPIWQMFFFAVILAPLWEEAAFRLPLRYAPINLTIPFCLGMILVTSPLVAHRVLPVEAGFPILLGTIALGVLLWQWLKQRNSQTIHTLYERWIGVLFYGFALAFGLIHISNFTSLEGQAWLLAPLLILPQTVVGLFLGFIRLRHGFWWAVFTHGFHNACAMTPFVLTRLGSENLHKSLSDDVTTESLVGTDYILMLLTAAFLIGGILISLVTVWRLIAEWRTERRQAKSLSL